MAQLSKPGFYMLIKVHVTGKITLQDQLQNFTAVPGFGKAIPWNFFLQIKDVCIIWENKAMEPWLTWEAAQHMFLFGSGGLPDSGILQQKILHGQ